MCEIVLLISVAPFSMFLYLKYSHLPCLTAKLLLCVFWSFTLSLILLFSHHSNTTWRIFFKQTQPCFTKINNGAYGISPQH